MPAADLELLIEAALAAGEVSRGFAGGTARIWEKADNAGPVTEADLAVNERLAGILRPARPDYGWLSEESPDSAERLAAERVFIIDPIDGTRSFIDGATTWAHAIAVAERGVVTAAVIHLPMRDELFAAATGQGATLNGAPIAPSDRDQLEGAAVLAARPALEPKHWNGEVPKIRREYRPSLAYRLASVAEGRFDAMITLRRTWEWDVAAGDLILREAGATVTDRTGNALRFNNPHPAVDGVLAGGAKVHAGLLAALTRS